MTSNDLIECGLCDDLAEVFEQFPMEFLSDFGGLEPLGRSPESGADKSRDFTNPSRGPRWGPAVTLSWRDAEAVSRTKGDLRSWTTRMCR